MKKRPLLIFFCTYLFCLTASSQSIWHFGQNAGVSFLTTPPNAVTNSSMNTPEGCAVLSNPSELLFYTNGQTVWNKMHNVMTNGTGLNGNPLATQSAVIVRTEGMKKYYVFTVDALAGNKGLCYSVVDMSQGNLGRVEFKNTFLRANMTEKLTVIQHCNKRDAWLLAHEWGSNRFFAWKVTKNGVDSVPVISEVGSPHIGNIYNTRGYMKVNFNNDKIALCVQSSGFAEIFDFDNTFGIVSNPLTISNLPNAYGVEFSRNGNLLYVTTTTGYLYQYSVVSNSGSVVNASRTLITFSSYLLGALQLGLNEKIYVAQDLSYYLGVIDNPDANGPACNFSAQGQYLGGRKSEAGLPPRVNDVREPSMIINEPCVGDTSIFSYTAPYLVDSLIWNFGDSLNAPNDVSSDSMALYLYPKPGIYNVTLILYRCNSSDTIKRLAAVKGPPRAYLGPDTSICDNVSYVLSPGAADTFLWSTGSTASSITVNLPAVYWVELINECGRDSDTMELISIYPSPVFELGTDSSLCEGDSLVICLPDTLGTFLWNNGDTLSCLTAFQSGNYQLSITNKHNCTSIDNRLLTFLKVPSVDLGNDTTICIGKTILLNAGKDGSCMWSNGSSVAEQTILESGNYSVTVTNQCGTARSEINVIVDDCEKTIWIPDAFMPQNGGENAVFRVKGLNVSDFDLSVFNRYGQLIFHSKDINQGWDGKFLGEYCQIGVYVWLLTYSDHNGKLYQHKGTVTLIR